LPGNSRMNIHSAISWSPEICKFFSEWHGGLGNKFVSSHIMADWSLFEIAPVHNRSWVDEQKFVIDPAYTIAGSIFGKVKCLDDHEFEFLECGALGCSHQNEWSDILRGGRS
jgi:hypothetical protein